MGQLTDWILEEDKEGGENSEEDIVQNEEWQERGREGRNVTKTNQGGENITFSLCCDKFLDQYSMWFSRTLQVLSVDRLRERQ